MCSLYKYYPVYDFDNLDNEYAIKNVLNNHVTFSTRSNFNDIFDSKIDFQLPHKQELKRTYSLLKGSDKREFKKIFLGVDGKNIFAGFKERVNKKFDSYLFFCLTDKADNNLMWSHYANSHKGFCIEWDSEEANAEPVIYQDTIATFNLLEVVKEQYGLIDIKAIQKNIWRALKVKLNEWRYEGEHRVQLGKGMEHLIQERNDKYTIVSYDPKVIKSIIFGCRMDKRAIKYLDERLPPHIVRKYAKENLSSIKIIRKN
jgi:hypothetical protein